MSTANYRDQRNADAAHDDRALMCVAGGCPNLWSVDAGDGRLCSAHAASENRHWPQITQEQLDALADRALRNASPPAPPPRPDVARLRSELGRLAQSMRERAQSPREWAHKLRDRNQCGERLTSAHVEAYQGTLDGRRWMVDATGEVA